MLKWHLTQYIQSKPDRTKKHNCLVCHRSVFVCLSVWICMCMCMCVCWGKIFIVARDKFICINLFITLTFIIYWVLFSISWSSIYEWECEHMWVCAFRVFYGMICINIGFCSARVVGIVPFRRFIREGAGGARLGKKEDISLFPFVLTLFLYWISGNTILGGTSKY